MAKITIERLLKKYNFSPNEITGINYRTLISDIIEQNAINTHKAINRLSKSNYESQMKLIKTKEKIIIPNLQEVFPKRSVFLRKAAQEGNAITDTLRDSLTGQLRRTLSDFKTKTGLPAYLRRAGKEAGTINPKLIKQFEKSIMETYTNYTKKDPSIGYPRNVHAIAVTEIRATINNAKNEYNQQLYSKNRDKIKMFKQWIHNKSLSKESRLGHELMHRIKIDADEMFSVSYYKNIKGIDVYIREDAMQYPHDPNAPPEQVISCNCDVQYFAELRS